MGKIWPRLGRVILGKNLVKIASLVGAVLGDCPFVPDMDVSLLEPADVVAGDLVNPEHFENGGFVADFLRDQDGEFF